MDCYVEMHWKFLSYLKPSPLCLKGTVLPATLALVALRQDWTQHSMLPHYQTQPNCNCSRLLSCVRPSSSTRRLGAQTRHNLPHLEVSMAVFQLRPLKTKIQDLMVFHERNSQIHVLRWLVYQTSVWEGKANPQDIHKNVMSFSLNHFSSKRLLCLYWKYHWR